MVRVAPVSLRLPRLFRGPALLRALDAELGGHDFQVLRYCRSHDDGPAGLFRLGS